MIKEFVMKGWDLNNTKLNKKLIEITDGNTEFLDDYTLVWEISKSSHKTGGKMIEEFNTRKEAMDYRIRNKLKGLIWFDTNKRKYYIKCSVKTGK